MEQRQQFVIGLLKEWAAQYSQDVLDEAGIERVAQILTHCGEFSAPVRQALFKAAFANYKHLDTLVFNQLPPESWKILREGLDLRWFAPFLVTKEEDDIAFVLMLRFPDRRGARRELLAYLKGLDSRKGHDVAVRMDHLRPYFEPWKLRRTIWNKSGKRIPNYYVWVGLPKDATAQEVRAQRKLIALAMQREYGLTPTSQAAMERIQRINDAFVVLSNSEKRAEYDHGILPDPALYPLRGELNVYVRVPAKIPEK